METNCYTTSQWRYKNKGKIANRFSYMGHRVANMHFGYGPFNKHTGLIICYPAIISLH